MSYYTFRVALKRFKFKFTSFPNVERSYHLMELPTKILIGEGVLEKLGSFVEETSSSKKIVIVSGKT